MIREVGESIGRAVLDGIGRAASRVQERKPLPADLLESNDTYLAVFDAPAATADDVQVRFDERTVTVRVDRFREFYDGYEMRFPGRGLTLDGRVTLPDGVEVDANDADATLTSNGTLEVRIPKVHDDEETSTVAVEANEETTTTDDSSES